MSLLSMTTDSLRDLVTYGSLAPIVIGLVLVKLLVNSAVRIVVVVVALALAGAIFLQRQPIDDCIEKVQGSETPLDETCRILWIDVDMSDLADRVVG